MSDTEKRVTAKLILDDSGYNSKLKGVNAELKNNQAALKAASSGLEAYGRSEKNVASVQQKLQRQMELQTKKIELYKSSMAKTSDTMKKNISEREKVAKSIEQEKEKLESLKKTYGNNNQAVRNTKERLEELQKEYDETSKKIENNAKKIQNYDTGLNNAQNALNKTTAQTNKFNTELAKNNNTAEQHYKSMMKTSDSFGKVGKAATNVGGKLTSYVTLPLGAVAGAAAKVGIDFEAQMDKVAAISGATGNDFKKLEAKAEEMGAKTKFSASEAGEGLEYMAMAGWKTNDMLEGIEPVLNLAIASGEDLGKTSDIVTDALTAFGLKAKDAGMFSDVLATASSNANTNVGMMGETFKYAAPVAGALGYNVQDTALAIGLMANSGIKASQAGTALRAGLTNLVKPTDAIAAAMKRYNITVKDGTGKVKPFKQMMEELRGKLGHLDKATQAATVSQIFGKEAMSGWLAIINASKSDFDKLSGAINDSEGATAKMAKTMNDNAKGSLAEMKSALEEAGIKVFKALAPSITSVANSIGELANKFSKLSPETQAMIVNLGLLAIASGPVIKGFGGIMNIGSKFIKLKANIDKARAATTAISTAAEVAGVATAAEGAAMTGTAAAAGTATVATGGLAASLVAVAAPALAIVAVLGAVGFAAYKISEHFKKSATPAVDLFADKTSRAAKTVKTANGRMAQYTKQTTTKISESTKKAVGAYMELDKKAVGSLMDLKIKGAKITKENSKQLVSIYKQMGDKIKAGMDKHKKDELNSLKDMFSKTKVLTGKEQNEILKKTNEHYKKKKGEIDEYEKEINEILKRASDNHRELTKKEVDKVTELREKLRENAIKTLSKNEVESKVILERMKDYDGHVTAEQASTHIKELNKLRDDSVKAANEECDKRIAEIIRMRDESKVIGKEQADKLIEEAKRQKKDTVQAAEDTRNQAVEKITSMSRQVSENVNTTTGDLKTNWDKFKEWWNKLWFEPKTLTVNEKHNMSDTVRGRQRWTGDNWYEGGFTTLHERGYELYDLPSGTRIYNHDSSEELVKETAKEVAKGIVSKVNTGSNGDIQIIVKNYLDNKEIGVSATKEVFKNMKGRNKNRNLVRGIT